mmetsp:Transcript_3277/g.9100  ORF Transcript_3277/g.9100 Transcript_3277/m.9100 type:complete len:277 (+) Transcript_3277:228-1058(+)
MASEATEGSGRGEPFFGSEFVSGSIAGACGVFFGHPLDTIKTRLQTTTSGHASSVQCAVDMTRREGFRSFYRGLSWPLLSKSVEQCLIFGLNEKAKRFVPLEGDALVVASGALAGLIGMVRETGLGLRRLNPTDVTLPLILPSKQGDPDSCLRSEGAASASAKGEGCRLPRTSALRSVQPQKVRSEGPVRGAPAQRRREPHLLRGALPHVRQSPRGGRGHRGRQRRGGSTDRWGHLGDGDLGVGVPLGRCHVEDAGSGGASEVPGGKPEGNGLARR